MRRPVRRVCSVLAVAAIALAATGLVIFFRPDREVTLLIYLPGITVAEALYGLWAGIAAVGLSVAGSAAIRMWFLQNPLQTPVGFYTDREEQFILLAVGLFVVALTELRRRSGARAVSGARQLAALMQNVADAVLIFDTQLRVAAMNPAAQAIFNRPGETAIGETMGRLRQRFDFRTLAGGPARPIEDATQAGMSLHDEGTIVDLEDHRSYDVLVSVAPWRNQHNRIEGTLVMIADLTPLKEMQRRELANARHLALAQMISGLTHDFSHVLDIIRRANAMLELRQDASGADRRQYRQMIERAADDGAAIVRRLRDYLAGGTDLAGRVDLAATASEAIALTRPLWSVRPEIKLVETLEPVPAVQGNANDLRRVLINLIFNAVEALGAQGGQIEVHTGRAPAAPGAPAARVIAWVQDSGPGIPPELQERIFQPYVTSKAQGLGLGLFSAQKILLAHGGKLSFTSGPGRGTRFTLELPALESESPSADAA